jgi:hypothetical protein
MKYDIAPGNEAVPEGIQEAKIQAEETETENSEGVR